MMLHKIILVSGFLINNFRLYTLLVYPILCGIPSFTSPYHPDPKLKNIKTDGIQLVKSNPKNKYDWSLDALSTGMV